MLNDGHQHIFSGALIAYRARYQPTVTLSSTERKFVAALEAGKLTLYLRSLSQLGKNFTSATKLHKDNTTAIVMVDSQRPARRTCHMDIRHFALLDWVEHNDIVLAFILIHDNPADSLTKPL